MDKLNNDIAKGMYVDGTFVRGSSSVEVDGLKVERASGVYSALLNPLRDPLWDEQVHRYQQEYLKQDPSMVGLEIIEIETWNTSAAQARRLGLAEGQTFNQFSNTHRGSEDVKEAFLKAHFKRSKEITVNWDRIDNAYGAAKLGLATELGLLIDPVGTVGSLIVEFGTEKVVRAAGFDEQTAAMISGIAGVATGGAISYRQMANAQPSVRGSVRDLLHAQRAARAEYDAVRLAARAAEFEASKGVQIAEGVTLFKSMPSQARAAKAGYISPRLDVPMSAGVPDAGMQVMSPRCRLRCILGGRTIDT